MRSWALAAGGPLPDAPGCVQITDSCPFEALTCAFQQGQEKLVLSIWKEKEMG